jgi:hypothetical protein
MAEIKHDKKGQALIPFIEHNVDAIKITQRAYDGYINATALCKACGKMLNDYARLDSTKAFLTELIPLREFP